MEFRSGSDLVKILFSLGSDLVQIWFGCAQWWLRFGLDLAQIWLGLAQRSDSVLIFSGLAPLGSMAVTIWFRSGSGSVQIWFMFGSAGPHESSYLVLPRLLWFGGSDLFWVRLGLAHRRSRLGTDLVKVWVRIGSKSAQDWF